ncbi:MAG: hypothetical protein V2I36_00890 [Desulfopila sp.]|jgi:hypothetical protein|nr:hypothetical protein [Desulfopila sp.]
MSLKDHYLNQVEEQFKEWKYEIDKIEAQAEEAEAETKIDYLRRLDTLKGKQREAKLKLKEIKEAGEESWEDLKTGYEKVREDLQKSIENAQTSFT